MICLKAGSPSAPMRGVGVHMRRMASSSKYQVLPPTATVPPNHLQLLQGVISEEQEKTLISFIDTIIKRKRYEKNHFDSVILNYRETEIYPEKLENCPEAVACLEVLEKTIRENYAGGAEMTLIPPHVIDLHATGFIAPHVDSIKFSGDMIASLSLGSSRILRLKLDPEFAHLYSSQDPSVPTTIECAVHPRSLYILSGPMRYHYTHEILGVAQTELTTLTEINTKEIANDENEGEGTNSKGYSLARRLSIMHRDEKKHSNIQS